MSDPTSMPFQDDEHRPSDPQGSIYEGQRPDVPSAPGSATGDPVAGRGQPVRGAAAGAVAQSDTDLLAAQVSGPEDHVGMTALWRLTMSLPHWWFVAVGDEGLESPAAATINDQLMLLTFTHAERARDFAVQNGMIGVDEDLRAIALPPHEVVQSAQTYQDAGIGGLMFDPHIAGYFIPTEQLPVVWDAVHSTADDVDPVQD